MNIGLIVAAGRGHRLGGPIPKQYRELNDLPIIRYTTSAFRRHPEIDAVQVLIHPSDHELYEAATEGLQLLPPLIGGHSRQESVRLGLEGIADLNPDKVIIHDAVRPFVEQETITAVLAALDDVPCAIAGVPVSDTLKRCRQDRVVDTIDRSHLYRAQTPQGFRYRDILAAHRKVHIENPLDLELTDDAMVAERVGMAIGMVLGTDDNFKITTEMDLLRAEAIIQRGHREIHTGWGFDTQPLRPGDYVMICGIPVALAIGMTTMSETDVALNAITRAMLGTVGGIKKEPDFRPHLTNRRMVNSENLIREAVSVVAMAGGRIEHIDLTLITEQPEIASSHAEMVRRTALLLSVPQQRISVKCIDIEDMGFAFRRDALSAQCLATINYPADMPE
ncbi:MAG: 2-C-methyl-D-erythritol 4-phosphate cytidylyltransferase [Rhodospirillales bacterium 20-64-7]|jgi:2-C-methyl-D-erythritol 4-phosphate cytidylyltransferase/2-C-methyl-D-erythritol 2,4-cyclodiphosphate synthase|nr:MAG: 2-C-methyl-D-erythritol 4-phosphate cytidylyltransferase [Rhodospirillales bacterium 20-64-7]